MPLPVGGPKVAWPPAQVEPLRLKMGQWAAWFSGDLQQLQAAYGGGDIQDSTGFFASDHGGFRATVGRTLQRWFVGEPTRGPDRMTKLPVPIAAELCQASADLLFADPVVITAGSDDSPDTATQAVLDAITDDRWHSTIAEAAEHAAALGGVYLRTTWDPTLAEHPFTTYRDADSAAPEFRHGRLIAVTFWNVVDRNPSGKVTRLLERHEVQPAGNGVIQYGLYVGDDETLGDRVPLDASPATIGLAQNPDLLMGTTIDTKTPGLAVEYVANQRPHRLWREHPIGRHLGRSDLDGIEHLMDQLAEVMSAWTRAIRLGKARIFLAKHLLKSGGPGNGAIANLEQEAYTSLDSLGGADQSLADQVQMLEPRVNYEQYAATAKVLTEQILQGAGYSLGTFGISDGEGRMRTATEVEAKERRSLLTRDRKIREWRPALDAHLRKMIAVDRALFTGTGDPDTGLAIGFTDGVQESQLALAQTALALYQSESASRHERVAMLHPDWDEEQIDAEVALLEDEFAAAPLPEPGMTAFGDTSASTAGAVAA